MSNNQIRVSIGGDTQFISQADLKLGTKTVKKPVRAAKKPKDPVIPNLKNGWLKI